MSTELIINALASVRKRNPLVVNITNYVVMNTTANVLLALGASPIMAHSQEEMGELMTIAGALVINIGTLDSGWIPRMKYAIDQANCHQKPVVLDPVGCGATTLRTQLSLALASQANNLIIRANASEIIALSGQVKPTKGVDSLESSEHAIDAAITLVNRYQCNVVISGPTDYVVTSTQIQSLNNGSPMMARVTGTGCCLSALTGAFAAIGDTTGLTATAIMGIAGELATAKSQGPGSLQVNLLDTLYSLNDEQIKHRLKMNQ